jgi:Tfp pilus assembly protein PilV
MVATLVLTIGLGAMAQLLGISTLMHLNAREASTATQLAQAKIDELMKLNLATAAAVQVTPVNPDSLTTNVANYFDSPQAAITRRWRVQAGPAANTRLVTVRVINARTRQYGSQIDVSTIIRQW